MAKKKNAEQLEAGWWDDWWLADYSWDGLSKKSWEGWFVDDADGSLHAAPRTKRPNLRPANLQDYWRDEASDLLTSPDGQKFTRVHSPLRWRDGTPTGKAEWKSSILDEVVRKKLLRAESTSTDAHGKIRGHCDRRAQLAGGVFLRAIPSLDDTEKQIHLCAPQTYCLTEANYSRQHFGADATFAQGFFARGVRLNGATFAGRCSFEKSVIVEGCLFHGVEFKDLVTFDNAVIAGRSNFGHAKFKGTVWFWDVEFREDAKFDCATFAGNVQFRDAEFCHDANFLNASFGSSTTFEKVTFRGVPGFEEAQLHQDTSFDQARFPAVNKTLRAAQWRFWIRMIAAIGVFATGLALQGTWQLIVCGVALIFGIGILVSANWLGLAVGEDTRYERMTRAFRTLTLACEKLRNRRDAARFYKLELKVVRLRPSTRAPERFFSLLFDITSDYGESMLRPLLSLAIVITTFAGLFWAWEGGGLSSLAQVGRPCAAVLRRPD